MADEQVGRCHCGAVELRVPGDAFGVVACHCDDCQKMHGNFFAMIAAPTASVAVTGAEAMRWYASSEHVRRSFCGTCGSRLVKEAAGSGRWLISVGLFGPRTGRAIRKQVWEGSKPDWYALPATEAS